LQESQLAQQQAALESLQATVARQETLIAGLAQQQETAVREAQLELVKNLLPILDSLDAAFNSGRRQVLRLPMSQEARQALIAWLDGLRLARMRLLDLLAAHEVTPIPTIGQPFDPHRHVAVATDSSGRAPDGVIVGEDRRGYASPNHVLRFAEVVVARSAGNKSVEE
jgi:molecular chaperone GrpE